MLSIHFIGTVASYVLWAKPSPMNHWTSRYTLFPAKIIGKNITFQGMEVDKEEVLATEKRSLYGSHEEKKH